jgi:hypothetical protein
VFPRVAAVDAWNVAQRISGRHRHATKRQSAAPITADRVRVGATAALGRTLGCRDVGVAATWDRCAVVCNRRWAGSRSSVPEASRFCAMSTPVTLTVRSGGTISALAARLNIAPRSAGGLRHRQRRGRAHGQQLPLGRPQPHRPRQQRGQPRLVFLPAPSTQHPAQQRRQRQASPQGTLTRHLPKQPARSGPAALQALQADSVRGRWRLDRLYVGPSATEGPCAWPHS